MEIVNEHRTCRLCLKNCISNFEIVDEIIQSNLNSLLMYLDFEITEEPAICESCSEDIKHCLNFKSMCILSEKRISSLMGSGNDLKRDLRELYKDVIENDNLDDSSDSNVCRLCLEVVMRGAYVFLENDEAEGLQKYFPELDFDAIYLPVACIPCHESLSRHLDFISGCLQTEKKVIEYYNMEGTDSKGYINLTEVVNFHSKSMVENRNGTNQFKTKDVYVDSKQNAINSLEIKAENVDIKSEVDSSFEGEIDLKADPLDEDSSQTAASAMTKTYKCTECRYTAKTQYDVRRHMLHHKSMSEVVTYNCKKCAFKTKYKSYLPRHMVVHKSTDEATMAKCHLCDFQTKQVYYMTQHLKSHNRTPGAVRSIHRCGECNFETKHKKYLRSHMLVHKTTDEVKMYNCMECAYETKYRRCLQRHVLLHRTSSEVKMYKCVKCNYESKYKDNLTKHKLLHKESSEDSLLRCTLCNYKTKRRSNLRSHTFTHKNPNVYMYKCHVCSLKMEERNVFDAHLLTHKKEEANGQKGVLNDVQECYFVDVANLEASSEEEKLFVETYPDSD